MSMNVFFQPFVGKDYTTGGIFGKRIMVLGESHYCDEGCADCGNISSHRECMAFTNGVVGDYLNEQKPRERWQDGDDITIDGYTVYTGSYALSGGGRVKVIAVNHPSVGYSWDYWHKVIEAFLK